MMVQRFWNATVTAKIFEPSWLDSRQPVILGPNPNVALVVFHPASDQSAGQAILPGQQTDRAIRFNMPEANSIIDHPKPDFGVAKKLKSLIAGSRLKIRCDRCPEAIAGFAQTMILPNPYPTIL